MKKVQFTVQVYCKFTNESSSEKALQLGLRLDRIINMSLWPHFLAHRVDFRSRTVLGLIACTHFVDAACGVRRSVVSVCVCLSVCLSVGQYRESYKNG